MDVKTTFLNGTPNEKNYLFQPKGFVHPNHLEKVFRLFIIFSSLKQSSRMWYERFNFNLFKSRFTKCVVNPHIYMKNVSIHFVCHGRYVDDSIQLVNDDEQFLHGIQLDFSNAFEMINIGPIEVWFQIQVNRNVINHFIHLSQDKYFTYIFKHFGMLNCKLVITLSLIGQKLIKDMGAKDIFETNLIKIVSYIKWLVVSWLQ
jgi:hypothetical protein